MKRIIFLLPLLFLQQLMAQSMELSQEDWREDLRFLQETIHREYPHLFFRTTAEAFDQAVADLHQAIPGMEVHEIIVGFASLIAQFRIGHSVIQLAIDRHHQGLQTGFHLLPIHLYQFSDGIYVQAVSEPYARAAGAKVIRIGQQSIEQALHSIESVVSAENQQYFQAYGLSYLVCPEVLHAKRVIRDRQIVPIHFEKDGREFRIDFPVEKGVHIPDSYGFVEGVEGWVSCRKQGELPLYLQKLEQIYHFEYLEEEKLMYVRHSQIRQDEFASIPAFFDSMFQFVENHEVEKLVLDLRLNAGGNNYNNKEVILGMIKSRLNQEGQLFTIIGRRTFSAAQNLVNELETYTETIFVGEPTAENVNFFGDTKTETLPNSGLEVRLSHMWWQDKDPRDKRLATSPHLPVALSFEAYVNNQDPVLEAIIEFEKHPLATLIHLKQLYLQAAYEEASKVARDLKSQYSPHELPLQSKLNAMGYQLIHMKQLEAAKEVFLLNTELYPESANAWDSLAEVHLEMHDRKKAIFYYHKTIMMDPDGRTGKHAQEMLDRIHRHMPDSN